MPVGGISLNLITPKPLRIDEVLWWQTLKGYFKIANNANLTVYKGAELKPKYKLGGSFSWLIDYWPDVAEDKSKCGLMVDIMGLNNLQDYFDNDPVEENLLLFVNGYRNNLGRTMNTLSADYSRRPGVSLTDFYSDSGTYWTDSKTGVSTGNLFINKISTKNVAYIDGHNSIITSNHIDWGTPLSITAAKVKFAASAATSYCANGLWIPTPCIIGCYHNPSCVELNDTPNPNGFNTRYMAGLLDGADLYSKIFDPSQKPNVKMDTDGNITGKIDIVCHSMGFAHALGVIDYLNDQLADGNTLGGFYIIAPENDCSASPIDLTLFEGNEMDGYDVFQYGTNELLDPAWVRDGVAPQCPINATSLNGPTLVTRAFIPEEGPPQSFTESHFTKNFWWIILNRTSSQSGYVKTRN